MLKNNKNNTNDLLNSSSLGNLSSNEEELHSRGIYYITGEIEENSLLEIHQDILLKYITGAKLKELTLVINTVGGDVAEEVSLIDLITVVKEMFIVKTIAMGNCMSAGAELLAIGTKGHRIIAKNCSLMIHEATHSFFFSGKKCQLSILDYVEQIHQQTINFWLEHSNCKSKEEVEEKLLGVADKYLTPEMAIKLGIADEILGQSIETDLKRSPTTTRRRRTKSR